MSNVKAVTLTRNTLLTVTMVSITTLCVGAEPDRAAPLPRITVLDGKFVENESGKKFNPRGFNYIRVRPHPRNHKVLWHDTFNPQSYDRDSAEAMFSDLERHRFNVVRVFIDHTAGDGVVASRGANELSPAYMADFFDFLERARRHSVYVIPALVYIPECQRYTQLTIEGHPKNVGGHNLYYLSQGHIDAKAQYCSDFVRAIEQHDPALLSTIFAFELENETALLATEPPFSLTTGVVTPANGVTYHLTSDEDHQRMADDNVNRWADACVAAIRKVDPEAMVNVNVFTFAAVGRSGPAKLRTDKTRDPRFPARPLALTKTNISYLDIHIYAPNMEALNRDLDSVEFAAVKSACDQRGMPIIVGECGGLKHQIKSIPDVVEWMKELLPHLYDLGFAGFIYWAYNTDEQSNLLWNAKDGDGEILKTLATVRRGIQRNKGN